MREERGAVEFVREIVAGDAGWVTAPGRLMAKNETAFGDAPEPDRES